MPPRKRNQKDTAVASKAKRAKTTEKSKAESEEVRGEKKTDTGKPTADFKNESKTNDGRPWNLKISSWNVNGLRAWVKKNCQEYVVQEDPDIFCLQEIKCSRDKIPSEVNIEGYHSYWYPADKKGYSGTGVLSKVKPLQVEYGMDKKEHDTEGRLITLEYLDYYLITSYVPNSGRGLSRLAYRQEWDKALQEYMKKLEEKKPVILCGDLNVAHKEIDLANPKGNKKNAGFTVEEREGFTALLDEGFLDSFRHLYPDETGAYTFWSAMGNSRSRNIGWRLDYFVVSKRLEGRLCDHVIRSNVMGSDHCPVVMHLAI